ncbi:hypothetical protein SAMN04490248_1179 [Salinihabitans flavidus]|uniref:Uncharacterized protein n=1 Tax=Salinihabitans flavidus TaxID=569882 RepID=A0A1H8TUY7_9RHOB|nr:hypothetical protein SAMN04490248_1179 [Salinihabitans flavidus]
MGTVDGTCGAARIRRERANLLNLFGISTFPAKAGVYGT